MTEDVEAEFSSSAFEALERDFQEVLAQLVGDQSLERFRLEYEKLHRALKRSHEHERKLIKKVRSGWFRLVPSSREPQAAHADASHAYAYACRCAS